MATATLMKVNQTVFLLWIAIAVAFVGVVYSCNEQMCASIVSKCMLTQSCKCELKETECTCCKECFNCLNYMFRECCTCVDMCPKPNDTHRARNTTSLVDQLDGIPGLFNALTMEPDSEQRWISFTFPVDFTEALYKDKMPTLKVIDSPDQALDHTLRLHNAQDDVVTVNCTVAYMSQCLSLGKCRKHCEGMGATSMRWFYDGCCECVGQTCINYGLTESRCLKCSANPDDVDPYEDMPPNEDELDYGEGMEPLDVENTNDT